MARRIKVKLQDTTPARVVFLDPDATAGATLGTNVFTPDGIVGTPATVRAWLNVTESQNPRERPPATMGVIHHRLLQGLTLGDDHPQYTQWVQDEIVTGDWHFRTYDGILIENPDYLQAGIALTTITGADPLNNGIGNQLAFWEVGIGGAFTSRSYGFRIRHTGEIDLEGNLDWYRHRNDTAGVLFMRFTRDSSQIQFAAGTAAQPVWTTFNDLDTGMYFPAANTIGFSTGGAVRLQVNNTGLLALAGTAADPSYSFNGDTNTGVFNAAANILGFSTAGIERFRFGASGQLGIGGANFGTEDQALISGGSGAAPSWGPVLDSGTYTPTITNVANVAASTALQAQYLRIGNTVVVSGSALIDPTSASTTTTVRITLPIASAFSSANQLAGAGADTLGNSWALAGDITNDEALITGVPAEDTNRAVRFTFTYEIV